MHLLAAQPGTIADGGEAVDLGQTPGDIVILSAADTELACLASARAGLGDGFPSLRLANLLNLGHNFGHALELQAGYGEALVHGEAVAIGMTLAFDLSVRLGLCPPADAERARRHLDQRGLPTGLGRLADSSWSAAALVAHMSRDKKVRDGTPAFVLVRGIQIGRASCRERA